MGTLMRCGYPMRCVHDEVHGTVAGHERPVAIALPAQAKQQPLMVLPESATRFPRKRGHAARPGGGPAGETCGSCGHRVSVVGGKKTFSKCALNKRNWTHGSGSDITRKDPACALWASLSTAAEASSK